MGHYSWRCAKTTQGIPIQRYELTEAIAFLPNGDRVSGFLGNYGELLRAQYVGRDNQPLPEEQNLPDGIGMGVYELIGRSLTPHVQPGPDGSMAMADIDRMQDMVKLVRVEEVEPTDTYDSLPSSVPDPWGGYDYEYPEQWLLELAKRYDPTSSVINATEGSDAELQCPG